MDYAGLRRIQHSASTDELKLYRKSAFTLAEVLITLGIIGVVAAMTIPTLVTKYQKQEMVTQLQKAYSVMAQAFLQSEAINGPMKDWGVGNLGDAEVGLGSEIYTFNIQRLLGGAVKKYFVPYYKIQTDCGFACDLVKNYPRQTLGGSNITWKESYYYVILLQNGQIMKFWADNNDGVFSSFYIEIDLNGNKKPNVYGKDVFVMRIVKLKPKAVLFGADYKVENIVAVSREACSKDNGVGTGGYLCGGWIQKNGWKIPDDYPW